MTTTTGLPAAEVTRPRTVLVATMFASAAAFMAFAGVLLVYISERASAETWFPEGVIELDELPAKYREGTAARPPAEPNNVSEALQLSQSNLKDHLQALEQDLIEQAMQAAGGIVAQAAKLLNMRRTTLVEKIRKYDIH